MTAVPKTPMTADEFIAWAMDQPKGKRYELVAGEVVAMSPERAGHTRVKAKVWAGLRAAALERSLPCEAFTDGISVRVDEKTLYEPDALVRCGDPLDDDLTEINDPVVVVEVVSPSSHVIDTGVSSRTTSGCLLSCTI